MPLFMCTKCGCVENTALSGFWVSQLEAYKAEQPHRPLCSLCDPAIAKWHDHFPRKRAEGYVAAKNGWIYSVAESEGYFNHLAPFAPVELPPASEFQP